MSGAWSPDAATEVGEIIRKQRQLAELSMRRLAALSGISNPYLSQIERGLREPSERVVEAIARSLETTAEALYAEAGLVAEEDGVDAVGAGVFVEARTSQAFR